MNKFLSLALAAALCAPAFAQKMGMTNTNAPTLQQSMAMSNAKISLDYTSITWADGKTMARLMDKEKGAGMRQRVNGTAKTDPLAQFKTSTDLMVGETKIPAGDYKVGFTISDDLKWQLNFMSGDKVITLPLELMENEGHEHKNLVMSIYAADNNTAGCYIGFGKHGGMVQMTMAKKEG